MSFRPSIRSRLTVFVLALLLMLGGLGAFVFLLKERISYSIRHAQDLASMSVLADEINYRRLQVRVNFLNSMATLSTSRMGEDEARRLVSDKSSAIDQVGRQVAQLSRMAGAKGGDLAQVGTQLEESYSAWREGHAQLDRAFLEAARALATRRGREELARLDQHISRMAAVSDAFGVLSERTADRFGQEETSALESVDRMYNEFAHRFLLVIGLIILLTLLTGYWVTSSISRIIGLASEAMARLEEGELDVQLDPGLLQGDDEMGVMARSIRSTADRIRGQVLETRAVAKGIESLSVTASAVASQLAASAEENYASLAESSTSMEEIKATAKTTAKKMEDASELTKRGLELVIATHEAAMALLDAIERIRERMGFLSDTIVTLNDKTREIMDVADTVEDLAEQSNLLAVNAAVEAAKAQEAGRGFAVVASEIKSMAEQSKAQAKEVKRKLEEVQRATSAAVMATEQGVKATNEASRHTEPVRSAMDQMARHLGEIAQMSTQTLRANQDLFLGVDQVNQAMEQIRSASRDNTEAIKKLESATLDLKAASYNLTKVLEVYRI